MANLNCNLKLDNVKLKIKLSHMLFILFSCNEQQIAYIKNL